MVLEIRYRLPPAGCLLSSLPPLDDRRNVTFFVTSHYVRHPGKKRDVICVLLHITSGDHYPRVGIGPVQQAYQVPRFGVRLARHGAGIDYVYIGDAHCRALLKTVSYEAFPHELAFILVYLAAERLYVETSGIYFSAHTHNLSSRSWPGPPYSSSRRYCPDLPDGPRPLSPSLSLLL